jgi:mRNA interferase RelE/StbE
MPPYRIEWLDAAKADVRALDRPTAMRVFAGILQFARTGSGDVRTLHGEMAGSLRLRLGDYRVLFTLEENSMRIFGVRHRSDVYR